MRISSENITLELNHLRLYHAFFGGELQDLCHIYPVRQEGMQSLGNQVVYPRA